MSCCRLYDSLITPAIDPIHVEFYSLVVFLEVPSRSLSCNPDRHVVFHNFRQSFRNSTLEWIITAPHLFQYALSSSHVIRHLIICAVYATLLNNPHTSRPCNLYVPTEVFICRAPICVGSARRVISGTSRWDVTTPQGSVPMVHAVIATPTASSRVHAIPVR